MASVAGWNAAAANASRGTKSYSSLSYVPNAGGRLHFTCRPRAETKLHLLRAQIRRQPLHLRSATSCQSESQALELETQPTIAGQSYSSPSNFQSPWLMLPPEIDGSDLIYKFFSLSEGKVVGLKKIRRTQEEQEEQPDDDAVCVGSSHGWLALMNPSNYFLFLSNPISGNTIKLPSIRSLDAQFDNLGLENQVSPHRIISKLILSASPEEEDCIVMASYGEGQNLAYCKLNSDTGWIALETSALGFKDIFYSSYDKLFLCFTPFEFNETLEFWDLNDPSGAPKRVKSFNKQYGILNYAGECEAAPFFSAEYPDKVYFVEEPSTGELLMVERFVYENVMEDGSPANLEISNEWLPYKTDAFLVFKFNSGDRTFRYLKSLDDQALFIGLNHSFLLPARDFPGVRPNSIYFTDDHIMLTEAGHDNGVYSYAEKFFEFCYYPLDSEMLQPIRPVPLWFTPNAPSVELPE